MKIISILNRDSGFFSQLFFLLNHFLYADENKCEFIIDSGNWLFKFNNGWSDYFLIYDNLVGTNPENNLNNTIVLKHGNILKQYKIIDYISAIKKIYKLNNYVFENIKNVKINFNIEINEYSGIFIRRGDKLISESDYIPAEKYIQLLLKINPDCKIIFLQTDDYSSFIELEEFILKNNLDIKIYTLCDKNTHGMVIFNYHLQTIKNNKLKYDEYLKTANILNSKSVDNYNCDEIKSHTLTMLTGIHILLDSKFCVLDYQSNVSRFIKLAHNNIDSVYDVNLFDLDLNKSICPAYSF